MVSSSWPKVIQLSSSSETSPPSIPVPLPNLVQISIFLFNVIVVLVSLIDKQIDYIKHGRFIYINIFIPYYRCIEIGDRYRNSKSEK